MQDEQFTPHFGLDQTRSASANISSKSSLSFAVKGPLVGCLALITCFSHHFLPILLSKIPSALFTANIVLFLPPEHHYSGDIVGCLKDSLRFSQHRLVFPISLKRKNHEEVKCAPAADIRAQRLYIVLSEFLRRKPQRSHRSAA